MWNVHGSQAGSPFRWQVGSRIFLFTGVSEEVPGVNSIGVKLSPILHLNVDLDHIELTQTGRRPSCHLFLAACGIQERPRPHQGPSPDPRPFPNGGLTQHLWGEQGLSAYRRILAIDHAPTIRGRVRFHDAFRTIWLQLVQDRHRRAQELLTRCFVH